MEVIVNKDNFEKEVINSEVPVIVDFYANWCMPCKMLSPNLSKLDTNYENKIKVCKINVDMEEELAIKHQVNSIPYLEFYKNGSMVKSHVGYISYEELVDLLELNK